MTTHHCNKHDHNIKYLRSVSERPTKINDIAEVRNGVATNADAIFTGRVVVCGETAVFNGEDVETAILKPCVKIGVVPNSNTPTHILHPYNGNIPYTEQEMKTRFPKAYAYLTKHKHTLTSRNADPNKWWLYGCSQGLSHINRERVILPTCIRPTASTTIARCVLPDTIVYAGLYLVPKEGTTTDSLYKILNSEDFKHYCGLKGRVMRSGCVGITAPMVREYKIPT